MEGRVPHDYYSALKFSTADTPVSLLAVAFRQVRITFSPIAQTNLQPAWIKVPSGFRPPVFNVRCELGVCMVPAVAHRSGFAIQRMKARLRGLTLQTGQSPPLFDKPILIIDSNSVLG
jgi:hypothetical protein